MISVRLTVAGFYFSEVFEIEDDASVLDLMNTAEIETSTSNPKFSFGKVADNRSFKCRRITVNYENPDGTRLVTSSKTDLTTGQKTRYIAGRYEFVDTFDEQKENTGPLFAWQYYIQKPTTTRGISYGESPSADNNIVPMSETKGMLGDGFTVVWRLIGIAVGPTRNKISENQARLSKVLLDESQLIASAEILDKQGTARSIFSDLNSLKTA
ncbi:MAG: hypothetical protein AAFZ01_02980 [Pseudomonadota bacterium]